MERTQIQFTAAQLAHLRRRAAVRGVSVSAVAREAVDRLIAIEGDAATRERMIAAIGGFRSGRPDVGARHDEYLADDLLR